MTDAPAPITPIPFPWRIDTMSKLNEWIADIKRPMHESTTALFRKNGFTVEHTTFKTLRSFVIGDAESLDKARRSAIETMAGDLHAFFMTQGGELVWRIRPEIDEAAIPVFLAEDPDGPYKDFVTDRIGHSDERFGAVKMYARVACFEVAVDRLPIAADVRD